MTRSYTHYVFQTLTYNRENTCRHRCWWRISRDCTAYIQRIRRKFKPLGPIEFLRVIESHQDFYPHAHMLLYFHGSLSVDNEKFFDREFYNRLQLQWREGFCKPEVLRDKNATFAYALKYFLKQITDPNPPQDEQPKVSDVPKIWLLRGKRLTYFGMPIRLLAWSRGMQYLYCHEQYRQLISKGLKADMPTKLVIPQIAKQVGSPSKLL